jgi:hypothetical protein
VIYDARHDAGERALLNSAMGSRVISWSSPREPADREAAKRVREQIERATAVLVLCSANTATAPEVDEELRIVQERGKPYFLVQVGSGDALPPPSAKGADIILVLPTG